MVTKDETISYTDVVQFLEHWEIDSPIYWDASAFDGVVLSVRQKDMAVVRAMERHPFCGIKTKQ